MKRAWPLRVAATLVVGALLASCGGEAVEEFQPERVMAFGDEHSAIEDGSTNATPNAGTGNGLKYTVNSMPAGTPTPVSDCAKNPNWVQVVAGSFGLALRQCRGTQNPATLGRSWAVPGATVQGVDGIETQINQFTAVDSFREKDLVLIMGGMNDVLELYLQYNHADPTSRGNLLNQATQAGTALGAQVVRITQTKAKVVIALQPQLGVTPYGVREDQVVHPGESRANLLSALSDAFNTGLRLKIGEVQGGGRFAGLVLSGGNYANPLAANSTVPVCLNTPVPPASPTPPTAPTTGCDDDPLEVGTNGIGGYVYADYLRYTPVIHANLGSAAAARAHDNSF